MAPTRLRRLTAAVSMAVLTAGSAWLLGAPSAAADGTDRYVAVSGSDTVGGGGNNDCHSSSAPCRTIQHAVDEAGSGETIHVGAGTYAESVLLGAVESDPSNLTIVGAGPDATKVTGNPAGSGTVAFGFDIENVPATLRDLAVTGVQRHSGPVEPAVGVEVQGTSVTLSDVDVSGNADSGVIGEQAAITATGSHFDRNGTTSSRGLGFVGCGVIVLGGTASLDTSSASSNEVCGVAILGQLVFGRQVPARPAPGLSFTRSTAADNRGPGVADEGDQGAQVYDATLSGNVGSGLLVQGTSITVVHTTISDTRSGANIIPGESGITFEDQTPAVARLASPAKVDRTLRGMQRQLSGKARRLQSARLSPAIPPASSVTTSGSIVAANHVPDCSQHVTDGGYNLSSDAANSCGFSTAQHSLTKTAPKLGPLGAHGGATLTQLPLKASPAIDAEPDGTTGCQDAARDQRDVLRPQPTGGRCDIGAVELAAQPIVIAPPSLAHGVVGTPYSATITATGGQYPTYIWSLASGTLPDGLSFSSRGVISGTPTKAGTFTFVVSVNDPVLKTYTIVIDAAAGTNGAGDAPIAETGTNVAPLTLGGALAVLAGMALLLGAGRIGRARGLHRRA